MIRFFFLGLLGLSASSLLAQDLFRFRQPSAPPEISGAATVWAIEASLERLAADPPKLSLPLPSGQTLVFERSHSERRGPEALAWWGTVVSEPGWTASLTLDGDQLSGVLSAPEGTFEIQSSPAGAIAESGHRLVSLDESESWCPGGVPHPRSLVPPQASLPAIVGVDAAATEEITVLALYTEKALEGRGGAAKIENEIRSAVDYLTGALRSNGIDGRARLVHAQKAPSQLFGTKGLDEALELLRADRDVAALRSELRADIVTLYTGWIEAGGLSRCGLAYLMTRGENAGSMAPWAFNAINSECARSVLAHEIGHNLGLNHNPEDARIQPNAAFASYAYGDRKGGLGSFRTIMSYGGMPRISFFSTPSVVHEGTPIGVADQRDNARTLLDSLPIGARFQTGRGSVPKPPAPGNLQVTVLSPTSVGVSWSDPANDETGFSIEHQSAQGPFVAAAVVPADTVEAVVEQLEADTTYVFRVRTRRGSVYSGSSNTVVVTLPPLLFAPSTLTAHTVSDHQIRLEWSGGSESTATVEMRTPGGQLLDAGVLAVGDGTATLSGLQADLPHTFRLRLEKNGNRVFSPQATAATRGASGECAAGAQTLCLLDERFEVQVRWRNQHRTDHSGFGQAIPIATSDQSGLFQFFDPENIELVVKLLDGRSINDAFWHFFGALSDVEYWIIVRDTAKEELRTYHNQPGNICGSADTGAFPDSPGGGLSRPGAPFAAGDHGPAARRSLVLPNLAHADGNPSFADPSVIAVSTAAGTCQPSDTVLCLQDNRFEVEVEWIDQRRDGLSGAAHTLPSLSNNKTGFFWFFDSGNVELAVKLLDGRQFNDRFWFFWGGLSDTEYIMRIRDTTTGAQASYRNEPYNICGGADIEALE